MKNLTFLRVIVAASQLLFLGSCKSNPPEDECRLTDLRLIGNWKLIERCKPDKKLLVWEKTTENYSLSFNKNCQVTETGGGLPCTVGKYSIQQFKIKIDWFCNNLSAARNDFDFIINLQLDTLVLRNVIDESSCGSKYVKQ
jgi:hypothetical protein